MLFGQVERVRLLCVDTEESVHPDTSKNTTFGDSTSRFVKSFLEGKTVFLETESHRLRGNYGRLLTYIWLDTLNVNLYLVEQGWSKYYTKYGNSVNYYQEFKRADSLARTKKIGVWNNLYNIN